MNPAIEIGIIKTTTKIAIKYKIFIFLDIVKNQKHRNYQKSKFKIQNPLKMVLIDQNQVKL